MESLIQLAIDYGIGVPFVFGGILIYVVFSKVFKVLEKIENRLHDVYTKQETEKYMDLRLEPTNQVVGGLKDSMDKLVLAFEKLDDTMDEIKQELARRSDS